jgi:hypothetical protein
MVLPFRGVGQIMIDLYHDPDGGILVGSSVDV